MHLPIRLLTHVRIPMHLHVHRRLHLHLACLMMPRHVNPAHHRECHMQHADPDTTMVSSWELQVSGRCCPNPVSPFGSHDVLLGANSGQPHQLTDAQRAALQHIARRPGGVLHCEVHAEDLVALLREELVQFCTADIVEVTPHGRRVLGRTNTRRA